jgi:hypothetical protein
MRILHVKGNDEGWRKKKKPLGHPELRTSLSYFYLRDYGKTFIEPVKSEIVDTDHLKLRIRDAVKIPNGLSWGRSDSRKQVFCCTKRW